MTFNKERILAEGGVYHGHENPLIESAAFVVTSQSMVSLAETGNAPNYIKESAELPKRMVIEGVFQHADKKNANGRTYPRSLWDKHLSEGSTIKKKLSERSMIGHLEHPENGTTDLNKGAILITDVWMESNGEIRGRAIIYNTPSGLLLQEYIATGTRVGISSRGTGTVDHRGIVQEDFQPETWDMVYNPSTFGAYPTLQTESVDRVVESTDTHHAVNTLKIESPKTMTLSQSIAEARQKAEALLATDPVKLSEGSRKKHIDSLLDLRVSIAEQFVGEKRVQEIVKILESIDAAKKVAEDIESGEVGGFRSSPIGDKVINPALNIAGISKAIGSIDGDEAKEQAVKTFNEMAELIASNLSVMGKIKEAVLAKDAEAKVSGIDAPEVKEALEAARTSVLDMVDKLEAAEAVATELAARYKVSESKLQEVDKALKESASTNEKLIGTIAEMTAKPVETKIVESVEQKVEPVKQTLAERIKARSKQTNESTLPAATAPGTVLESTRDAGEVSTKSSLVESEEEIDPSVALLKRARVKMLSEGYEAP